EQKRRFQQDKIANELQLAQTAILTTAESIRQAQRALASAKEALDTYRLAFDRGQVDLVFLNLVEPKVTEYEIKLIEQEQKWYSALAAKQAALGLDPLEQAMAVDGAVN
ncbi:MAG: TolC family protein, partial [Pirellulaceae bacterium]